VAFSANGGQGSESSTPQSEPTYHIELCFRCTNIRAVNDMHLDTRLELYERYKQNGHNMSVQIGETDIVKCSKNPHFTTMLDIVVRCVQNSFRQQQMLLVIQQVDSRGYPIAELGRVEFGLYSLCQARKHRATYLVEKQTKELLTITGKTRATSILQANSIHREVDADSNAEATTPNANAPTVVIGATEICEENCRLWFRLGFSACMLRRHNGVRGQMFPSREHRFDTYLTISRGDSTNGHKDRCFVTDVCYDTVSPEWAGATISFQNLCAGDDRTVLQIEVFHRVLQDKGTVAEDELIGEMWVTIDQLREAALEHKKHADKHGETARHRSPRAEPHHSHRVVAELKEDVLPLVHRTHVHEEDGETGYTDIGWLRVTEFECYWSGQKVPRDEAHREDLHYHTDEDFLQELLKVRKMPRWPRTWANVSLLYLYSNRDAWANLHSLGQPNTFLAQGPALRIFQRGARSR
jgi:hypothetical protein